MHVVSDILPGRDLKIDIPKHDRHVCTYVHCENRSLIQCFVLMRSAVNVSVDLSFVVCCYACCVPFAWRPLLMNLEPRVTTAARRVQSTLPMHQPYHCFQLFNSCVHAYSQLTTSTLHLAGLLRGNSSIALLQDCVCVCVCVCAKLHPLTDHAGQNICVSVATGGYTCILIGNCRFCRFSLQ